ncbi:feruloyl-CoA synthase [Paroceanicella profunda]|uniref:Feruloyl-CoA synthase n=1 Tax=Paroceanicella profunda TaxID=2579971 RepID=A0A5B8FI58_9RHOB|nr:feruloyl-CoA synthase [Paroceanicella profunda]QDL92907.1 feruloyl-CoA synthase [Paroceanicella profunda]
MPLISLPGLRPVLLGDMDVSLREAPGGVIHISSRRSLGAYPRAITDRLDHWAELRPDQVFLADRGPDGAWRKLTYAEARRRARNIAQALIDLDLGPDRPLAILSGNSLDHGLLALGAMLAGVPYAPVSPAYSLVSTDYAKLRHVLELITPGALFVQDTGAFAPALAAVGQGKALLHAGDSAGLGGLHIDTLEATTAGAEVDARHAAITPDTVAKFLFTSGSTGMPKAVINTQRMLACNQQMMSEAWAYIAEEPPVLVDWLPWNHTAGGNHNFGMALYNGGTLYIDDGAPTPKAIDKTVRNLAEISPTIYFNVPKGYEMLCEHLGRSQALRERFFARVKLLQYAGASLSQHVWDQLERYAMETVGEKIMIVTGYGSTETAPFAFTTTWPVGRPGEVGLPAAGLDIKLVPNGEKMELRLRGPSITPGYWRQPDKTAESFDDEGFYQIGDALKMVVPGDVSKGFLFDGRVTEDFKLSTGTWVNFAAVRSQLIHGLAPYVRDAVLTGLDRGHIGAILFLDVDAARKAAPGLEQADEATLARHPALVRAITEGIGRLAETATGSSTLVARVTIAAEPPSIDRHEMTDKGSINQRAVLAARPGLVEDLYAEPAPAHVLCARAPVRG